MIKKIDLYIIRKFLGTFFFILFILVLLSVVIDYSEKIDDMYRYGAPGDAILDYYLTFIPHISALLGPFFMLITVIFFTSQLAGRSELVAMLGTGINFYRILVPYLFTSTLLAGLLFAANHYFVPETNKTKVAFEDEYVRPHFRTNDLHMMRKLNGNTDMYVYFYDFARDEARRFEMFVYDDVRSPDKKLLYKLSSNRIEWLKDTTENRWRVHNYIIHDYRQDEIQISRDWTMDTVFNITPNDFIESVGTKEELTTPELKAYIQSLIEEGKEGIEIYQTEYHRRTASAFSVILLTIIGFSLASRKTRGGLGLHLILGIALSFLYEGVSKATITFSINASLPPVLGAWLPNVIYAFIAIYLLARSQK
jgi:lipopolysaccharide export system permease protein